MPPTKRAPRAKPAPLVRRGWCFLRRSPPDEAIAAALREYPPSRALLFTAQDDRWDAEGPGWSVRIQRVQRLTPLLAEIKRVGSRVDELRRCGTVLTVDASLDEARYPPELVFVAAAPFGRAVARVPWQGLIVCEALHQGLAAYGPLTYDAAAGFYTDPAPTAP